MPSKLQYHHYIIAGIGVALTALVWTIVERHVNKYLDAREANG